MNLNIIRLRNLVNNKLVYEDFDDSDSEEDSMNKYNSDEESQHTDSDSEEASDKQGNEPNNNEKSNPNLDDKETEDQMINTYTRTIDKDNIPIFKWKDTSFFDEDLILLVNSISTDSNNFGLFLTSLNDKLSLENEEMTLFYSNIFAFVLRKVFCYIKLNALIKEIASSFNLINTIAVSLIQKWLTTNKDKTKDGLNRKISLSIIQLCDYVLELYLSIITIQIIDLPKSFFLLSLKYIQFFLSDKNRSKSTQGFIFVRKYIESFSQLVTEENKYNLTFSIEELKDLFSISFTLLSKEEYSNIYITIIDIICYIIERVNEASFEEKFIENMLLCFDEFLSSHNYSNDRFKYYLWNKQVLRNYKFYFGEYNCLNSGSISLFTYLFLKFYSVMFAKEDFIKSFEMFLVKLFEWTKPSILLCLCCLMNDLMKIKYNAEFTISLIIITNIYLSVSSLLSQTDLELNKRKLLLNLMDYFFDDLLNEFAMMKNAYFCLGKSYQEKDGKTISNKTVKGNVKKKKCNTLGNSDRDRNTNCDCFSCGYSIKKSNHFHCEQCHCKTNLTLQLIDPDKDDNASICGFCNMKSFFENSGMLFEKEHQLKLIDTNEDLIEEYSKSKHKQEMLTMSKHKQNSIKEDIEMELIPKPINLFDKFIYYQEVLYQHAFLFLKINIINFIRLTNSTDNKKISVNIDNSFKIFLKILINDQKMKSAIYKNFTESVIQFYTVQKERLFNLQQDIQIENLTINYFFFFHFYVNFLFAGHWKLIDLILNEKGNWMIRYKSLKILEKFIMFEGNSIIFQNFDVRLIAPLLCDNSFNIREYSLDLLFKLYKNKRIERGHLIYILYENINESSFLIRKRIIKALSGLINEEGERGHEQGEDLSTIIVIFLNKLNDNSESIKIKNLIYNLFKAAFNSQDELKYSFIDILVTLLRENEDFTTGTNLLYSNVRNLFDNIAFNQEALTSSIDYLIEQYLFNKTRNAEEILQALNLMRIISYYEKESVIIYLEYISDMVKYTYQTEDKADRGVINRIVQTSCEILSNLFDETNKAPMRIKTFIINALENNLIGIILNKPCCVMTSAIEVYFKMIHRGLANSDKINLLTLQNYNFLLKYYNKGSNMSQIPEMILTKSLSLLSYIIYSIKDNNTIMTIFNNNNILEITNSIFNVLVYYTINNQKAINFRAFEALGFFWIKYPFYLSQSTDVINHVINHLASDEDKVILLKTFYHFFSKISLIISSINNNNKKSDTNSVLQFDFGIIHLFFEQFINKFSLFLIKEPSVVIRTHTIHFIKLIIELGNVNVHNILPHVFTSLFDISPEIRHISVCLLERIIQISKEKFIASMKECLKSSYAFHKTFYVNSKYFTSFVKEKMNNKEAFSQFNHTTENIFELFNYKMSKYDKHNTLQKGILEKFVLIFSELSTIENLFSSSSSVTELKNGIDMFEYYEFISKLIGDFKYTKASEVLFVFDKLFTSFETNYCVFKSKIKQYKDTDNAIFPLNNKDIFYFLQCGIESGLLKYLLLKYDLLTDETVETVKRKGWNSYRKETEDNDLNTSEQEITITKGNSNKKKPKRTKDNQIICSKKFIGIKFHEFHLAFNEYFKRVLNLQMKIKFNRKDKILTIELLNKLKLFNNMKLSQIKRLVKLSKKKVRKEPCEVFYEMFFAIEELGEHKNNHYCNSDIIKKKNRLDCTNVKIKKRFYIHQIDENQKDNQDKIGLNTKADDDMNQVKERRMFKSKKKKLNKRITIQ